MGYGMYNMKRCFREPIKEIFDVARYLDAAASAHISGNTELAKQLLKLADNPKVWAWTESIWGAKSKYVVINKNASLHVNANTKAKNRMPNSEMKKALHKRDGYHCRFCGIPVIHADIRKIFNALYPDSVSWGKTNKTQHAGFQCLWLQYDHVVPHSAGGENSLDNLIITCSACNYGKANFSLEELGLFDPRDFEPVRSLWDGLERIRNA